MANISFYGSHNAAVVVEDQGKIVTVIEVERFLTQKNAGYSQYLVSYTRPFLLTHILQYIKDEFGISEFDKCYYLNADTIEGSQKVHYQELIPAKEYINSLHHLSHAACGFYQTDYNEALIISFDGGGNDGFFNVYHAEDRNNINLIDKFNTSGFLFADGNRNTIKLFDIDDLKVNIKSFKKPHLLNSIIYKYFRKSKS